MTRHGLAGAILATLMLVGQAGAQTSGCNWTDEAFWDNASVADVERCVSSGADIEARDEDGLTPLHVAAGFGTAESVKALIDAKADIEAQYGADIHRCTWRHC
ncbi:MAG: ankyrin repeat domain-containing protein [Rhodospirillales bacterium]|nr:ankyrin repeat domain-containing protein [Rhodospirillales bacterium]